MTVYEVTPACPGNNPNRPIPYYGSCYYAVTTCRTRGQGSGPLSWIWARQVRSSRVAPPWVRVSQTCNQRSVPYSRPLRPSLTKPMVQRAFRELDFARPQVAIQPEGTQTLVNFETYYRVQWPQAGVAPVAGLVTVSALWTSVPKVVATNWSSGVSFRR